MPISKINKLVWVPQQEVYELNNHKEEDMAQRYCAMAQILRDGSIRGWSGSQLTYSPGDADSKSASSLRSLPQLNF